MIKFNPITGKLDFYENHFYRDGTILKPIIPNDSLDLGSGRVYAGFTGQIFYVDGSRVDTYTENGSYTNPYKTIKDAQDAINVITATLMGSEANYDTAKFIVNIAPGTYSDNLTINTNSGQAKYLRYNMEGVTITGDIEITQNQAGVSDYYSKVEFVGGFSTRPEKGRCGRIEGDITFLKSAYDSLSYDSFYGIDIEGDILYGATPGTGYGTWVLYLENSSLRNTAKSVTTNFAAGGHCVLLEVNNSEIRATLTGEISLYTCNNSSFSNMTITPEHDCTVKNCTFSNSVSIMAVKNLNIDANSYRSLLLTTPTLTGMTIVYLDQIYNNNIAETINVTKGGTGLNSCLLGDILYGSAANTLSKLAGNATTTKKFLSMTGDGTNPTAPTWEPELWTKSGSVIYPTDVVDIVSKNGNYLTYANSNDTTPRTLGFYKSRGTYASPTIITTGDYLGEIVGYGYDGDQYIRSASIRFKSSGTIADNRIPSQIEFWTSTDANPSVETKRGYVGEDGFLYWTYSVQSYTSLISSNYSIGTTSTNGLLLKNLTAATAGTPVQMSPRINLSGTAYNSSSGLSETNSWIIENLPVTAAGTTTAILKFGVSINGGAYSYPMTLSSTGILAVGSDIKIPGGSYLYASESIARGYLRIGSTSIGNSISRNVNDVYTTLTIDNINASSTGHILDCQWQSVDRFIVFKEGGIQSNAQSAIAMGGVPDASTVLTVGWNNSTMAAGTTAARGLLIGGNITELAGAAITDIVGAYFNTFTITDGGGAETVGFTSTVYIANAPTVGTAPTIGNYALFVDAGEVRIDGEIGDTTNRVTKGWFTDLEATYLISTTQYFGDKTTDGSWKMEIESGDLVIYKKETGTWVEKGRYE